MKLGFVAGATMLALGFAPDAAAMNLQPGMLTMMQQGGLEHGVQVGCALPGYDPRHTCAALRSGWSNGDPADGVSQRPRPKRLPRAGGGI